MSDAFMCPKCKQGNVTIQYKDEKMDVENNLLKVLYYGFCPYCRRNFKAKFITEIKKITIKWKCCD